MIDGIDPHYVVVELDGIECKYCSNLTFALIRTKEEHDSVRCGWCDSLLNEDEGVPNDILEPTPVQT